jgi:DNA-binding transcriptional ArsR family regulator
MATKTLGETLFSGTRAAVLGVLVLSREPELHVREIARRGGVAAPNASRELAQLEQAGVVRARQAGRQRFYRMDPDCSVYHELTAIVRKTSGLAEVLRAALEPLTGRIELAYIYGSMASGKAQAHSDVDVLIVGELDSIAAAEALSECERDLGRPVNVTIYPAAEYRQKLARGAGFPFTAHSGPRILLLGVGA